MAKADHRTILWFIQNIEPGSEIPNNLVHEFGELNLSMPMPIPRSQSAPDIMLIGDGADTEEDTDIDD